MELVRHRAVQAPTGTGVLRRPSSLPIPDKQSRGAPSNTAANDQPKTALSEQSTLILALIDSLPFLAICTLEEWLPIVAELTNVVQDPAMAKACKVRFWEVLSSGEMDVERAALSVAWWGTRGGRELVLNGHVSGSDGPFMHGGLADESRL